MVCAECSPSACTVNEARKWVGTGPTQGVSTIRLSFDVLTFIGLDSLYMCTSLYISRLQVDGKYSFSPSSSVCLTEVLKLILAVSLHSWGRGGEGSFFEGVSWKMVSWQNCPPPPAPTPTHPPPPL